MCLSDLGRIVEHDPTRHEVVVDVEGRTMTVSTVALGLEPVDLAIGEWLIVHTGFAIERITAADAKQIRAARQSTSERPAEEQSWN